MPYLTRKNLKLQLSPGLVASYDIQPGNGVGLFWNTKHTPDHTGTEICNNWAYFIVNHLKKTRKTMWLNNITDWMKMNLKKLLRTRVGSSRHGWGSKGWVGKGVQGAEAVEGGSFPSPPSASWAPPAGSRAEPWLKTNFRDFQVSKNASRWDVFTSHGDFIVPWFNRQLSNSSFSVAAPSAWNRLPSHIRTSSTYTLFLTRPKTHLFAESLLWLLCCCIFTEFLAPQNFGCGAP